MSSPAWGCPWHGLVQASSLTLPNGQVRPWPQPEARTDLIGGVITPIPDTYGATYRVAVPGTPAVTRSASEYADDIAAGRQWWSEAALSGARQQLYGKPLDGWLYTDPAGARWLVRCAQLNENVQYAPGSSLALTVTLTRFGEIGGAFEQYSYTASITDWGLNAGYVPASLRLVVDDVRGDGARAALMAHVRAFNNTSVRDVRRGMSWLELQLTGEGAAATVEVVVLRRQAEVYALVRSAPVNPAPSLVGWQKVGPGVNDWEWVVLPGDFGEGGNPPQVDYTDPATGVRTIVKRATPHAGAAQFEMRRLLAVWYGGDGALLELRQLLAWQAEMDWPLPSPGASTATTSVTWAARLQVGSLAAGGVVGSYVATSVQNLEYGGVSAQTTTTVGVLDGAPVSSSGTAPGADGSWITPGRPIGVLGWLATPLSVFIEDFALNGRQRGFDEIAVIRYANHVIGQFVFRPAGVVAFHPPATPDGLAPGEVHVPTTNRYAGRYGSWCPYSGQVTWRGTSPVCYV